MTAGIAVLNRNGVALAADSLGLVKLPNEKKKFIIVDKIFPLSKHHSVGFMIYDFFQFMGTPWDTIIKLYREHTRDKIFDTLQEYGEDFIKFLSNDERFTYPLVEIYIIKDVLDYCIYDVIKSINLTADYEKTINDEIENRIISLSKDKFLNGFDENFINVFIEKHNQELKKYIQTKPEINFDVKIQENLIKLCAYVISKSDFLFKKLKSTGVVIIGYGNNEIFPSLYAYDVYASINGKLIYKISQTANIRADNKELKAL